MKMFAVLFFYKTNTLIKWTWNEENEEGGQKRKE
jgi:hypothetical protein